jgi:hypothetical protein
MQDQTQQAAQGCTILAAGNGFGQQLTRIVCAPALQQIAGTVAGCLRDGCHILAALKVRSTPALLRLAPELSFKFKVHSSIPSRKGRRYSCRGTSSS